eukprot:CAMPEP_0178916732 /NCGR_PEP_ID=MMETSP0786-20121207/12822_1 /TAXON_ID=186022 /ORGANISM="Thalassionema frauenfeldii, Strain CCMP 1798" /LENGTH=205 /DNA_ID=CAMNT_0020590139 /DNA_START=142 /DNA_END=759 /DNA_ORIENTATION=+
MEPENQLRRRGFSSILGSDESGNGCVAGPIVVSTCAMLRESLDPIDGVDDSKKLSPDERRRIFNEITTNKLDYAWNVVVVESGIIDETDVPTATKEALKQSIEDLVEEFELPTYSIVDGHKTPKLSIPMKCRPWVKGDAQVYTIALASIIAKCTHDNLVLQMHERYPQYGFKDNKGYPTRDHVAAIHKHGPCPLHRMTAKPLKGR